MTDDTRDRDRPFVDAGESTEPTNGGEAVRSTAFDRTDRAPAGATETAGTPEATSPVAEQPTVADPDRKADEDASSSSSVGRNGDQIEERLRAVERALTETDDAVADLGDEAAASAEREELATRLDDLEARVEEIEAATQAIRGYVGSIRSVNQAVERRADLALARASENVVSTADGGGFAVGETDGGVGAIHDDGRVSSGEATREEPLDAEMPSEAALDAAVPSERHRESGAEPKSGSAVDRPEADSERTNESWRAGALDRLRESL